MAMRITTKMMQNTSLRNLNTNKARQEKLTTQLATGKKISRPSDDPVIAIRALRLNASLDKIDQYYEKNAKDAESWLGLTSAAIDTVNKMLTNDLVANINQLNNNYQTAKDRQAITENLRNAIKEIYATGNADSAGRSLFTGYRTDLPLTLKEDKVEKSIITEPLTNAAISKKTFVATGDLKSINEGNFTTKETTEYDVSTNEIYRIRLSYADVDIEAVKDANGNPVLDADGNQTYTSNIDIGYMKNAYISSDGKVRLATGSGANTITADVSIDVSTALDKAVFEINGNSYELFPGQSLDNTTAAGAGLPAGVTISYGRDGKLSMEDANTVPTETASIESTITADVNGKRTVSYDEQYKLSLKVDNFFPTGSDDAAYWSVIGDDNADKITYIADTGELLLGTNIQKRLSELDSDTELRVTYEKTNWKENDLDPVHYFNVERQDPVSGRTIKYNSGSDQVIEYDIGNNQTIRVNTNANELFCHDMGRDVDDIVSMLEEYDAIDNTYNTVKNLINSGVYTGEDQEKLEQQLAALEKARTMIGDKLEARSESYVNDGAAYISRTTLAETACGARGSRLTLIQNRLSVQQTNFEELVSENEDADYTELAIQLKSIEMTYQAALSSISYVMQTSLLDFI